MENNGGTTLLSPRAGGRGRAHLLGPPENAPGLFTWRVGWGNHQKMPQAYSLGESVGAQEKVFFFVS